MSRQYFGIASLRSKTRTIVLIATATLIVLVIALVTRSRANGLKAAYQSQCNSNLSSIAAYVNLYKSENGKFPTDILSPSQKPLLSWRVELLKKLDPELYAKFEKEQAWNSPHNLALLHPMPQWYCCWPDKGARLSGITSYYSLIPTDRPNERAFDQLNLASSDNGHCLMLIEASGLRVPWTCPQDLPGNACTYDLQFPSMATSACSRPGGPCGMKLDEQRISLGASP